jgi:hypothetical protein
MATGFSVNPGQTTNATGTFNIDSTGSIQGVSMDSPAVRNRLVGGVVAQTELSPMFGGIAIAEDIPTGYVSGSQAGPKALGGLILRATGIAGSLPITGFTVFDQAHNMLSSPQSPVPQAAQGMSVNFYRLGSSARIPLACDPSLISFQGGLITQQVSWDFAAQRLVPYAAAYAANVITAATYNNTTGVATYTTTSAHGLTAGQDFSISGITPVGYNGSFTAFTGTAGSTLTVQLAAGLALGAGTVFGTLVAGGGALPIRILELATTNCLTVTVDPVTGFATWNRNGACALALI